MDLLDACAGALLAVAKRADRFGLGLFLFLDMNDLGLRFRLELWLGLGSLGS